MKKLLSLFALLLFPLSLSATTAVTGHISNLGTGSVTSGTFVRFWLRGCGGNQPRITGTALIGPSQGGVFFFDFVANGSGNVSGTLYSTRDAAGAGNGEIECGGSYTAVWYGVQAFSAGKGGPEFAVHAKSGGTLDISTIAPISVNPVVTAPTGDTTYARLDGGNQPFLGGITAPTVTAGVSMASPLFNATTGYQVGGAAPSGHVLRGNGTNYIDAILALSDLSGSVTCSILPALIGDVTSSAGSCTTVVGKVNGVAYGTNPASNTVPVVTAPNTITYEAVPNAALANASTTVNSQTCTLGGSCTIPIPVAVQSAAIQTSTGTAIGNSNTTWVTKAVTMPSAGCPCRAFVSYGVYFTTGGSGTATFWVEDGTSSFATARVLTNAAGGNGPGASAASFSPNTYANNANVTFIGRGNDDASGGITTAATPFGSAQNPWLNVVIFTSN